MNSKYIVQYSGGITSYWAARRSIESYGVENVVCLFADVLMEDADTYRFISETISDLGCEYVRVADGRCPWQVFRDERFLGNSRADPCSKILKRELLAKWIRANCDLEKDVIVYGLDWTEPHRIKRVLERAEWQCGFPLNTEPFWSKLRMLDEVELRGIMRPRLYTLGFPHNNCGGACVKAGQAQWALLLKSMPDRYAYHEAKEQELRDYLGKNVAILKSKKKPLTLQDFRARVEANEYDMFDFGGCGCAVDYDDGEVTCKTT